VWGGGQNSLVSLGYGGLGLQSLTKFYLAFEKNNGGCMLIRVGYGIRFRLLNMVRGVC